MSGSRTTTSTTGTGGGRAAPALPPLPARFEWRGVPTRVLMEAGAVARAGEEAAAAGMTRVMVVSGARTARSKTAERVREALGPRLAARFEAIPQHSSVATVAEGVARARAERIDGLVAFGGGSASDTAKAIAIVLGEGGSIADHANIFYPPDHYVQKVLKAPKLPIVIIPTTASAAEVTPGLGIKSETGKKLVFWDPVVVPRTIILDAEANLEVPAAVMASTGMNAFAHCVEGLYSRTRNPVSEALALAAAARLAHAIPAMVADPASREARAEVLIGAHLSGHVIANARVGLHHAMCHGIGSHGGLSHGDANAIMLPHVLRYNRRAVIPELAALAAAMGEDVRGLSAEVAADRAIAAVERLQERARVPRRLRDAGFDRAKIAAIATMTLSDRGAYFNPIPAPPAADIERLMQEAW